MVKTTRHIVEDIGPEAASSSKGLKRLAECSLSNAERDTHTLLSKRMKLSLPIPLKTLGEGKLDFPVLRLRDWAQFLLDRNLWHVLCGLVSPNPDREKAIFRGFWSEFQRHSPQHPVFVLGLPLEDTVPMVFHGDEGRGRRRQGWLATNYHSIIGRGSQAALEKDAREKKLGQYVKLRCNYVGHSLTNRFGHAGLPKAVYSDPDIFKAVLEDATSEALFMTDQGVSNPRMGTRYMIVLNVVGDWSWLHKAGSLCRTYHNMGKAGAKAKAKSTAAKKSKSHPKTPWASVICAEQDRKMSRLRISIAGSQSGCGQCLSRIPGLPRRALRDCTTLWARRPRSLPSTFFTPFISAWGRLTCLHASQCCLM